MKRDLCKLHANQNVPKKLDGQTNKDVFPCQRSLFLGSGTASFSLRSLCDLCVSAVNNGLKNTYRRDAENAQDAQRSQNVPLPFLPEPQVAALAYYFVSRAPA
jgi:hypothetical protein